MALAGDFYANWSVAPGDVEQISDNWDTNSEQSVNLALKNAQQLSSDEGGYLNCILSTMEAQNKEVSDALRGGQDPAQVRGTEGSRTQFIDTFMKVYHNIADKYNLKYAVCTNLGYALIGLCNWDHFGNVGRSSTR